MRRMETFRRRNKAIIFITHNLYQVEAMCNSAVWLEHGQVVSYGRSIDVLVMPSQFESVKVSSGTSVGVGGNRADVFDPGAVDRAEEERMRAWVERIRAAVDVALGSRFPMLVLWGPGLVQVYNEMHGLIVGIGKNYCRKSQPKCDECPLQGFLPGVK